MTEIWATVWNDDPPDLTRREPPWGDLPNGGVSWCAGCPGVSKTSCCAHLPKLSAVYVARSPEVADDPKPSPKRRRLFSLLSLLRRSRRKETLA